MKKIKNLLTSLAFLTLILSMTSCAKDGETGPTGATGNANVKAIFYTATPSQWNKDGSDVLYIDIKEDRITSSIYEYGAVLTYIKSTGDNYIQMPYTIPGTNEVLYAFAYNIGELSLILIKENGITTPTVNVKFKFILIEGTPGLAQKTDFKTYNEAAIYYNIKSEL